MEIRTLTRQQNNYKLYI